MKLAGRMSSKPLVMPGRHLVNSSLLGANIATMGTFLAMAPSSPAIAAGCLAGSTLLSFAKGWTVSAAIGGADMPVLVTLLNSYSGLAICVEGFMLDNMLLTSVGSLIAASGGILSHIMVSSIECILPQNHLTDVNSQCKSMNRSLPNVIFGGIAATAAADDPTKGMSVQKTNLEEVLDLLRDAESVVIVSREHAYTQLS